MKPEKQQIAIAEAMGEINVRFTESGMCIASTGRDNLGEFWGSHGVPDWLNDLNAMHEVEESMTQQQLEVYCNMIHKKNHGIYWAIHATAAQRAEAFLRTIGKWEDEE